MIKNNMGIELLDLLQKIKERASKFENSPLQSSPMPLDDISAETADDDLDKEKIVRKLVF